MNQLLDELKRRTISYLLTAETEPVVRRATYTTLTKTNAHGTITQVLGLGRLTEEFIEDMMSIDPEVADAEGNPLDLDDDDEDDE